MTCYMRHMGWLFDAVELENDRAGRRRLDMAIRVALKIGPDAHCPEVWAAIKSLPEADRVSIVEDVRRALPALD